MNPRTQAWAGTKTGRTGLHRPAEWPAGRNWSVTETQGRYLVRDPAGVLVGTVYHHPGGVWIAALVGQRGGIVRGRRDQFTNLDTAIDALKSWWRQRAIDHQFRTGHTAR